MRAFIAGILALEEPKRAVSPSGVYSSSYGDGVDNIYVDALTTSLFSLGSEFTLMMWVKPTASDKVFISNSNFTFELRSNNTLRFRHLNNSATFNTVTSSEVSLGEWILVTVVGSSSNNELLIYVNDAESGSNIFLDNLDTSDTSVTIGGDFIGSYGCFRIWERALSSSQVFAHYAWDGLDPLTVGAVAVSAMTDTQKSDLNIAIEMVQDNPYDGSEYSDLSGIGRKVTNNNVELIGDSLQIYTNIADIPSGGTQIFDVNSANLNGVNQYFTLTDSGDDFTECSFFVRLKTTSLESRQRLLSASDNKMIFDIRDGNKLLWADIGGDVIEYSTSAVSDGYWHTMGFTVQGSTIKFYIDGINVLTDTITPIDSKDFSADFCRSWLDNSSYYRGALAFMYFCRSEFLQSYVDEISQASAKCFDDLSSELQSELINNGSAWDLSNFNGNTGQELIDQTGNGNDLTNVGSTPFNGTGLQVECTPSDTQIFDVDTVDLDGTSQYLELQGDTSRLNIGTDTLSVSGWVYIETTMTATKSLYWKQDANNTNNRVSLFIDTSKKVRFTAFSQASGLEELEYTFNTILSDGWNHITYNWKRTSATDGGEVYINSQLSTDGGVLNTSNGSPNNFNWDMDNAFTLGLIDLDFLLTYNKGGNFLGIAIGQELTQADAIALYNNGNPPCWESVQSGNPSLFNKFDATFDLGTYDGRTELQALTDHTNGWVLSNINNAPFVDQGLQVEC